MKGQGPCLAHPFTPEAAHSPVPAQKEALDRSGVKKEFGISEGIRISGSLRDCPAG